MFISSWVRVVGIHVRCQIFRRKHNRSLARNQIDNGACMSPLAIGNKKIVELTTGTTLVSLCVTRGV